MSRQHSSDTALSRRLLLQRSLLACGVVAVAPGLWGCSSQASPRAALPAAARDGRLLALTGALQEVTVSNDPTARMLVPPGFQVREVARSGRRPLPESDYVWHGNPDGGATFPSAEGGWVYVSNSEMKTPGAGGVGALRFSADGRLLAAYPVLAGTTNNCAGGPTPWGTWLSCEEVDRGLTWECDPFGERAARSLPLLGAFKHEAAAVDPRTGYVYLTEDEPDGNFYRFVPGAGEPTDRADWQSGRLQVLLADVEDSGPVAVGWRDLAQPVPSPEEPATRHQVAGAAVFKGGEGCWYYASTVYFTTKHDNRIWALDVDEQTLTRLYDGQRDRQFQPPINDLDNLTVSSSGEVVVAEDGAEMRLAVLAGNGRLHELVRVLGQEKSEICGPAFSPDGRHLYFSSQQGVRGTDDDGRIYQVSGPFFSVT